MLIPDLEAAADRGVLRAMQAVHRGVPVKAVRYSAANTEHHLFFAGKPGNWQLGKFASDARFLYCSTDFKQTVSQFVICEGSCFAFEGRLLFGANLPVKHRSEEHTSELQSPDQIVCRLLLENKNDSCWSRAW